MMTVLALYCRQMGNWIARSNLSTASIEAMTEKEEDVVTSSCSKKTPPLSCQHQQQVGEVAVTQWVSSPFLPALLHI